MSNEKLIPLRRVVFDAPVQWPRDERDASSSNDTIFERYPRNPSKTMLLWLTPDKRFVIVEHPRSNEKEEVPMSRVVQFQELTQKHVELVKNPPPAPGLRKSLETARS
jgi:hypothetical protein